MDFGKSIHRSYHSTNRFYHTSNDSLCAFFYLLILISKLKCRFRAWAAGVGRNWHGGGLGQVMFTLLFN